MSEVEKELEKKEDENLELDDQEQEDLQDDVDQEEEQQEEEQEAEAEEADEPEEEEKPTPSRREQLRIQQLLEKIKEEGPSEKQPKAADKTVFDDDANAPDSATFQKSLDDVYRFSRFETRLEVDAPRVEAKYPQLDKDSEEFNPVLANTINRMYLSFVQFDPKKRSVGTADVRYADYVESVYELAEEIAGNKVERTTVNLKKQASKTGVRPGGGSAKRLNLNKAPSEMTDEELDAVIRATLPKKR